MEPIVIPFKLFKSSMRRPKERQEALLAGESGFSLLEVLIATVILSVSILALTSLTITSMQVNLENDLRNASVRLTTETVETFLTQPIDGIVSGTTLRDLNIRGGSQRFTINWTVVSLTNDLLEIQIQVAYIHRGQTRTNNSVLYKHRAI
jgi:prepilin-type N-terminal cleavage/methylation domain-containing protein